MLIRSKSIFFLLLLLFLGTSTSVQAAQIDCSSAPYFGVIDGDFVAVPPANIKIDTNCTIQNFPAPGGLGSNFSFDNAVPLFAVFNNVIHTGQMSCNTVAGHKIWFTNGSVTDIPANCQNLVVPAETIDKQAPTSVGIGDPFTYTLTLPSMQFPLGDPSPNDLSDVIITDDLNATGADLSLVGSPVVTLLGVGVLTAGVDYTFTNVGGLLTFNIPAITAGQQLDIEITAVLNDTPANVIGASFTNTAKWQFVRAIDVNSDGFIDPVTEIFTLPGEWGIATTTIAAPDLVVTKTSPETALNAGIAAVFTVDVQNVGGSAAWNVTVEDTIPTGMCDYDPVLTAPGVSAQIFQADGSAATGLLVEGAQFTVDYSVPCQLVFVLDSSIQIEPTQYLRIIYQSELDATVVDGSSLINVMGATEWFSADPAGAHPVQTYGSALTDGSPGIDDNEDSHEITAALSGYFFEKTVSNSTTTESPATTAAPGDTLHYRLRFFNLNLPITSISISDVLDTASFDLTSYSPIVIPAGGEATLTGDTILIDGIGGTSLDLPANDELIMEFEIDLLPTLNNGDVVSNFATLTADDPFVPGDTLVVNSDDPFVNGVSPPGDPDPPDVTEITIQSPGALSKVNGQVRATIGEQFTYTITVPAVAVNVPQYDVRILDDLTASAADMTFVSASVVSGGSWTLTNTGTSTNLVIEDTITGIDIPAMGQAVIEVTVQLSNTGTNFNTLPFNNTASSTYNRTNGDNTSQTASGAASSANMTVTEPSLGVTKTVINATAGKLPTDLASDGDILQYSVTIFNGSSTNTAYDVNIVDTLPVELSYYASFSPVLTINGGSVGAFEPIPTGSPNGPLIWGKGNADDSLDIPPNGILSLTYQTQVLIAASNSFSNEVWVDWTSLQGVSGAERHGDGCPTVVAPNDYCSGPASVSISIDNNSLTKTVIADSWDTNGSTASDAIVRIGDIVTYRMTLNLSEGTNSNVTVTDVLPAGMEFGSLVSITPASGASSFTYTLASQPAQGNTGTLVWDLGDVVNAPSGDGTPTDPLIIEYTAAVLPDAGISQVASTILTNTATFGYDEGGTPVVDPSRLESSSSITVSQPILTVDKIASASGGDTVIDSDELITYSVNISNGGNAPASDFVLRDIIPAGLRNGTATITMVSTTLLNTSTSLTNLDPVYNPATGIATWDFDSGVADQYSIPAGDTLSLVYRVQADTTLSANMILTNQAQVQIYYSFDNDDVPTLGLVTGSSQVYGATNTSGTTLTTAGPNPLSKQNPATTTAAIGDVFTYRITVPATPMTTALNDVRILDDLGLSAADLGFVSVTRISGSQTWTPVNTGTASSLVIEDTTNGIDIPAGEQVEIDITVVLNDSAQNVTGLLFNNTASYTYNQIDNNPTTQLIGGVDSTADMTIIGADLLTMEKTGPAQMNPTIVEVFTLNVHNTGTATAWDLTITDVLPNPDPGGMCDTPPANITAQIFLEDATTPVSSVLVQDTDYTISYAPAPSCTLTITMTSAAAALPADNRLIVTYEAVLDGDNPQSTILTNIAGATEWFSGDTAGAGATGQIHTYSYTLTNGTNGTLDQEDDHSFIAQFPVIQFQKTVENVTTNENPATSATPGDLLRYSLLLTNVGDVDLTNFAITDELDRLNASGMFAAGSLSVVTTPATADDSNSDPAGGASGTGLLDVRNLNLDASGGANDVLLIEYEVRLAPVITNGTVVLNQAQLTTVLTGTLNSDDPNTNGVDDPDVIGDEDPTPIAIVSAPAFEVWKTSQDLTDDPAILESGDTLRYTITVKNIGTENALNILLQDQIPTHTGYVANSTTLNGVSVADPAAGVSALEAGTLINSPADATPGFMPADTNPLANNVATIVFDVAVNADAINGTVISNQAVVSGDGEGSGAIIDEPSDDPATTAINDPTLNILGRLPLIDAEKVVELQLDNNANGFIDPGDILRYTITVTNAGAVPATEVVLTDATPVDTTFVDDSVLLNGLPVGLPNGGVSPLIAGIDISTSDLTPGLPGAGGGILTPGQTATVIFDVEVDAGVSPGTIISNQGVVSSNEQINEPTDADGIDSNGDQPTQVVVGNAQLLSITKEVLVVGGGPALAGGQLEYIVRVTNLSTVPATDVVITDDLDIPVAGQMTYVAGSATLNGLGTGVSYVAPVISADYSANYGDLLMGETAVLRFRVDLDASLVMGTTVTNTALAYWNLLTQNAAASVSIDIGAIPGVANLNGTVWHDGNFDNVLDTGELGQAGWFVDIYRNGDLLDSVVTDANGVYVINGLAPNYASSDLYELRFRAPDAGINTALLGLADSVFTNNLQGISDIIVGSGTNVQNLNLPIEPDGVVYDSVLRIPVTGATLTLLRASTGTALPSSCFDDAAQQGQITPLSGYYKFDINFSDPACPAGADYLIDIAAPATGYIAAPSNAILPVTDVNTAAYSVPICSADAVTTTAYCEAQSSELLPPASIAPGVATNYYMHLTLGNGTSPQDSQLFNNHIPIDPDLSNAVAVSKVSSLLNVKRGQLVPYTITATSSLPVTLPNANILDNYPAGFYYVQGSARIDDVATEPVVNNQTLTWTGVSIDPDNQLVIKLLLVVGSGVSEGEYINRAQVIESLTNTPASPVASATVRVVPDPTFDCSDVIGKVFDDRNMNGYQDENEKGLPDVRLVSARGLIMKTDPYGRFHITCAAVPNQDRGSNFILKLDERSLPSGYRVITENPRVQRATRGKMMKFNFGATIHRVIRLDIADPVFEKGKDEIRLQWKPRLNLLIDELKKGASILRISYLADVESRGLVNDRIEVVKQEIMKLREQTNCCSAMTVETEVFWRRGGPPDRGGID